MNVFFMEDPDEPGTWAIPVVVIEGKQIKLQNIRKERLDFYRPLVAAIAKQAGTKAYFIEYEIPSRIEEIQPKDDPNVCSISLGNGRTPTSSEAQKTVIELIEKIGEKLVQGVLSKVEDKPDEDTVH